MDNPNQQLNKLSDAEIALVIYYFEKLGYKKTDDTEEKLHDLYKDHPDKDFAECAKQMYEWFSEANKRGRVVKSYHLTFRNWVKRDYAPKKKQFSNDFFSRDDLV